MASKRGEPFGSKWLLLWKHFVVLSRYFHPHKLTWLGSEEIQISYSKCAFFAGLTNNRRTSAEISRTLDFQGGNTAKWLRFRRWLHRKAGKIASWWTQFPIMGRGKSQLQLPQMLRWARQFQDIKRAQKPWTFRHMKELALELPPLEILPKRRRYLLQPQRCYKDFFSIINSMRLNY